MPVLRPFTGLCRALLLLAASVVFAPTLRANHYLGADITYTCQGDNAYLIALDLYLDCGGAALVPQTLYVNSDCGPLYEINQMLPVSEEEVSPLCVDQLANSTCNGGPLLGVRRYRFEQVLTLPPCSRWVFGWAICCRGTSVDLGVAQSMYVEATLDNHAGACDDSPVFPTQAIEQVCVDQPTEMDLGLTDPDGDRLAYALISGRYLVSGVVYDNTYEPGYSGEQPVPGIVLDTATGHLSFTTTLQGTYVFVLQATSYDADGSVKGTVSRDFCYFASVCTNVPPQVVDGGPVAITGGVGVGERHLAVCTGSDLCFDLRIADADTTDALTLAVDSATVLPGATFDVSGDDTLTAHVCWPAAGPVGDRTFTLVAADGACPFPHTQSFPYRITVTPPIDAGPDRTGCAGDEVELAASPADGPVHWTSISGGPLVVGVNFSCDTCAIATASPDVPTVYEVRGPGGCTDQVRVDVLPPTDPACSEVGVATHMPDAFTVYPNPSTGWLQVNSVDGRAFAVLDLLGRPQQQGSWTTRGMHTIALPDRLAAGPYILRIQRADGMDLVRFVVAR